MASSSNASNCFCGWQGSSATIACKVCGKKYHSTCVSKWIPSESIDRLKKIYVCGICRIVKMDPFHYVTAPLGSPVICDSRRPSDAPTRINISIPHSFRGKGYDVELRSVSLDTCAYCGPSWPYFVDSSVNGKKAFRVDPPKYLHTRREQCYDITNLIKIGGRNDIDLQISFNNTDVQNPQVANKTFLIQVCVSKPVTIPELLAQIRQGVHAPEDRYKRVLEQLAIESEEIKCVSHAAGRTMTFVDPVSHCRIETPCIGKNCVHLQTFDLDSYLYVNSQTRNLASRWHCCVCNLVVLPSDLVVDTFMSRILSTQKGIGKVVIKDDGGCEVIIEDAPDVHTLSDDDSESDMPLMMGMVGKSPSVPPPPIIPKAGAAGGKGGRNCNQIQASNPQIINVNNSNNQNPIGGTVHRQINGVPPTNNQYNNFANNQRHMHNIGHMINGAGLGQGVNNCHVSPKLPVHALPRRPAPKATPTPVRREDPRLGTPSSPSVVITGYKAPQMSLSPSVPSSLLGGGRQAQAHLIGVPYAPPTPGPGSGGRKANGAPKAPALYQQQPLAKKPRIEEENRKRIIEILSDSD